jgi:hypothetical protein
VQGGAICRGVLSVCDELGIDKHSVVDGFRKERHRESLERAQHAGRLTDLISSGGAPEPPFPKPGQRGRGSEPRRRNNTFLVDREQQPPIIHGTRKNRRPSWR